MSNILSLFDYVYYRVYRSFKMRGDNVPDTKGSLILSLMQFLAILDILIAIKFVHDFSLPSKLAFFLPLLVIIGVVNWYRYERDFDIEKLEVKWKNEDQRKRIINGCFIGLYLLISFLIPAVYGYLKYNLKVI